jgi:hypothetical protein
MNTDLEQMREGRRRVESYFRRIGDLVEDQWNAVNYEDLLFPKIAETALREDPPHARVKPMDVLHWSLTSRSLGVQPNADAVFGQPPITVYAGRRFYIEVLFWFDGTTSIHQHTFDGAFAVLAGGSIHSTYEFRHAGRTSSRLIVGDVAHLNSERLSPGSIHAIESGPGFIHALFHTDRPSVSVVVRTLDAAGSGPQYNYLPPYVGVDQFDKHIWNRRAVEYALAALSMSAPESPDLFRQAIRYCDDLGAVNLLRAVLGRAGVEARLEMDEPSDDRTDQDDEGLVLRVRDAAVDEATKKFGPYSEAILLSLQEEQRTAELIVARQKIHDPHHRYFLALLMNVPRRARLLELVREVYPDSDPVDRCCSWLHQLTGGDSPLLGYAIGEDAISMVDGLLRDWTMDRIAAKLSSRTKRALSDDEMRELQTAAASIREIPIIRPLFAEGGASPISRILGTRVAHGPG